VVFSGFIVKRCLIRFPQPPSPARAQAEEGPPNIRGEVTPGNSGKMYGRTLRHCGKSCLLGENSYGLPRVTSNHIFGDPAEEWWVVLMGSAHGSRRDRGGDHTADRQARLEALGLGPNTSCSANSAQLTVVMYICNRDTRRAVLNFLSLEFPAWSMFA